MTEPLMIGTRGWDHGAWAGGFYPPELPDDWRFSFYSNNLRSVLVPQETWPAVQRVDVAQWADDSDPAFRFVHELPSVLCAPLTHARRDRELETFLDTIDPVAARTAGLLLRIAPDTPVFTDWFEHLLNRLAGIGPVCADLPPGAWREEAVLAILDRQGAGLAWHCARDDVPRHGGRLLAALAAPAGAREVRHWIEKLAAWHNGRGAAGLFFDVPEGAAKAAQEARIIAELLGV